MSKKSKYPQGTITLGWTKSYSSHILPIHAAVVGGTLSLLYAFLVPVLDLRHTLGIAIGQSFLDNHQSTDALQLNMYFIAFILLIILSTFFAYGIYWIYKEFRKDKILAPALTAFCVFAGTLFIYFLLDVTFGFQYHFVF